MRITYNANDQGKILFQRGQNPAKFAQHQERIDFVRDQVDDVVKDLRRVNETRHDLAKGDKNTVAVSDYEKKDVRYTGELDLDKKGNVEHLDVHREVKDSEFERHGNMFWGHGADIKFDTKGDTCRYTVKYADGRTEQVVQNNAKGTITLIT